VPEIETEKDEAIRALAESELVDLKAQPDNEDEDELSNSSDEDYLPISQMPPWAHDREASGSSSVPP
jgi:hypothetical protein